MLPRCAIWVGCFAAAALASGCAPGACPLPDHCLDAARVDGSCQCARWETTRSDEIDVPYVVAAVVYPAAGNESSFQYGGEFSHPPAAAVVTSPVGSRWRTRVRGGDGVVRPARLLPAASTSSGWRLDGVTAETIALTTPTMPVLTKASFVDLPNHDVDDAIAVWVNPRATVDTDYVGNRFVRWGPSAAFPECPGATIRVAWLQPGVLLGRDVVTAPCEAAFLASLDAGQREAIAAYDGFFSPEGRTPQAFFDDPRFPTIENTTVEFGLQSFGAIEWAWTVAPGDDDATLATSEVALPGGEALLVEHTTFAAEAAGKPRTFGVVQGTGTDGCRVWTALVLDGMFGTALHMAGTQWGDSGTAACTR